MIKRVHIRNFKSLRDVTVDLDPLTVLIGRSGSGKTNFVHALRWLREVLIHRGARKGGLSNWDQTLSATSGFPCHLAFRLHFSIPAYPDEFEYLLSFFADQPGSVAFHEERLSLGGTPLFAQQKGKWVVPPPLVSPPAPQGIMLGSLTGVEEATAAYLLLTQGIGCYAFADNVMAAQNGQVSAEYVGLVDNGSNFLPVFRTINSAVKSLPLVREMAASLRVLKPHLRSVDLRLPEQDRITVTHELKNLRLPLDVSQESEGFRRFFACLLALNQTPPKGLLIFDEPEKGLYTAALSLLADEFKSHVEDGHGQILLITHSPDFLDHFEPDRIRAVEMDGYETKIGKIAPEQLEAIREHLMKPGELLTVDKARVAEPAGAK